IPAEQLTRSLQQRGNTMKVAPITPRVAAPRAAGPESEALKVAIHHPEAVAGKLHEVLFLDPAHRDAFLALASGAPVIDAIEDAPPEAAALLSRLAVEDADGDPSDVLAGLVRVAAVAASARLMKAVAAGGDFAELSAKNTWLKNTIALLDD